MFLFLNINNFQIEIIINYYISRINVFEWKNKKFFIVNKSGQILVLNYETFEIIQEINISLFLVFINSIIHFFLKEMNVIHF